MSTKKDIYISVKERLLAQTAIKHCLLFNNQFDSIDMEDAYSFPCAFVEFSQLDWVTKGEGYQEAQAKIRIHVGVESLATENLEVFDLVEEIHVALQGFHDPNYFTPLDRRYEEHDVQHDNVIVWVVDYDTLISDNSGNRNEKLTQTVISSLDLERRAGKPWLGRL